MMPCMIGFISSYKRSNSSWDMVLNSVSSRAITEAAWGRTWSSGGLPMRERSMITLALLAALGHWDEFQMHLRATRNTGASEKDIAEVLMHVAIYAGVPAANHAIKLAKATLNADTEA